MTVTAIAQLRSARALVDAPLDEPLEWAGHVIEIGVPLQYLEADWKALEACGTASGFQSWGFVSRWLRTACLSAAEEPVFVVGRHHGEVRLILPLTLVRWGGVSVLEWLAHSHANYGMGLLHPSLLGTIEPGDADLLIQEVARRVGAHCVYLDRQPVRWAGYRNPFACSICALPTANDTFVLGFEKNFADQYKRLFPKRAQQVLKRRRRRLDDMGPVSFTQPADAVERNDAIGWFIDQKRKQLAAAGLASPFDHPGVRGLYEAMADDRSSVVIDQVSVGDCRAAMGMTLLACGVAHGLNTAHDETFARGSPGTLLQHRIVEQAHAAGARAYDFGPGYLPYKLEWEPEVIPLLASGYLVSPLGLHVHAARVVGGLAKAVVKRNGMLARVVRWLRQRKVARPEH